MMKSTVAPASPEDSSATAGIGINKIKLIADCEIDGESSSSVRHRQNSSSRPPQWARREEMEDLSKEVESLRQEKLALLGDVTDLKRRADDRDLREDDDEEGPDRLDESIYSLMLVSPVCSSAFLFAFVVFILQLAILTFNLVDLVEDDDSPYTWKIPPGVDWQVSASQVICLLVAVAVQQDLIGSFAELHDGYRGVYHPHSRKRTDLFDQDDSAEGSRGEKVEAASWLKWLFSNGCRFLQGGMGLVVSFLLIVQSSEVIDLYFNFAALTFISELDNIFFWLVDNGFLFRPLRHKTSAVKRYICEDRKEEKRRCCSKYYRSSLVIFFFLLLLSLWIWIFIEQGYGWRVPQLIKVEFGDAANQQLGLYSREYNSKVGAFGSRSEYYDSRCLSNNECRSGIFAFCESLLAWTFTTRDSGDECEKHWLARSQKTSTYDITDTDPSEWFVRSGRTNTSMPIDFLFLTSSDCNRIRTNEEKCNGHGACEDSEIVYGGFCVCNEGWFGLNCEFREPCPRIDHPSGAERFPGLEPPSLLDIFPNAVPGAVLNIKEEEEHSGFMLSPSMRVNEHPVYFRHDLGQYNGTDFVYHLLLFSGRRWIVTSTDLLGVNFTGLLEMGVYGGNELERVVFNKLLSGDFGLVQFVSDPKNEESSTESSSPDGLQWYDTREESRGLLKPGGANEPLQTSLECVWCRTSSTTECENNGWCRNVDSRKSSMENEEEEQAWAEQLKIEELGDDDFYEADDPFFNVKIFTIDDWGKCECEVGFDGPMCQYEINEDKNCFDDDGNFDPECTCHNTCGQCGTRGNDPYDCRTCKMGLPEPTVLFDLASQTGCCPGTEIICPKCHQSCKSCGGDLKSCVECAEGFVQIGNKAADGTIPSCVEI